ncbi:DUF192 domain-containing protein [Candidatus Woesearchaeota archaeon]|nr:DUF192 domain-containing protein [Candidatus Woesearchaeota archaeon]
MIFFLSLLSILLTSGGCERQSQVCFEQACFEVEVADEPGERAQGLMHRESLDESKGMLFIFEQQETYSFWMKNTLIPLDIIWIDEKQKVVHIARNAQPCTGQECPSINPGAQAKYALEINANLSERKGISVGDTTRISLHKK